MQSLPSKANQQGHYDQAPTKGYIQEGQASAVGVHEALNVWAFTGTRYGMTVHQMVAFTSVLKAGKGTLHHGDCKGADRDAHTIALAVGWRVVLHPPSTPTMRAFCRLADEVRAPSSYLVRNHAMVDETHALIAAPLNQAETYRSGTWATVRYARKLHRPVVLLWPNGDVDGWPMPHGLA